MQKLKWMQTTVIVPRFSVVTQLLAVNVVMHVGGIVCVRSVHQHKNQYRISSIRCCPRIDAALE